MSLLARYLFANNTESTGIIQTTTAVAPTYSQEGPFGYCMTGTFVLTPESFSKIVNGMCQSISFWVNDMIAPYSSMPIMGFEYNNMDSTDTVYRVTLSTAGSMGLTCKDESGSTVISLSAPGVEEAEGWHNIIITNDNLHFSIYIDGVLKAEATSTLSNWQIPLNKQIVLGANKSIADLRFYDHVLSKKEIKDIQKAVSCHISFENISPTYMNRLCPDLFYPTSEWTFNSCKWDSGSVLFQTNTTSMLTRSTTGIRPTANHKYYGSVEYKVEGTSMTWADNRFEWFLNDNTNARVTFFGCPATTNYGWVRESAVVTAAGTMQSGTYSIRLFTINSTLPWRAKNPLIVDLTEMFGAGNEPTKEWCDEHIDYFNGIMSDNLPDNSGGWASITATNLFTCKGDPTYGIPVGQQCAVYNYDTDSKVVVSGLPTASIKTCSVWFRCPNSARSNYLISFRNFDAALIYYGIDIILQATREIAISYEGSTRTISTVVDTTWHHLCLCIDNDTLSVYLDSILIDSWQGYKDTISAYADNIVSIGAVNTSAYFTGMMPDVKFAGVPWTAEQVQDEYQSKIVLDKSYNLYSRYFETPKKIIPNLVNYKLGDETGWSGGSVSTKYTRVDKASRLLSGLTGSPESTSSHASLAYMTNGHVYYAGLYSLQEEAVTSITQSLDIYIPVAEPSLLAGSVLPKTTYQWYKHSKISTYTQTTGLQMGRVDYNNQNVAGQVWYTDFWIVDLTAYFGSGNEPTKEWCDKYLEYSPDGLLILDETTKFKKTESIINSKYSEVGVKGRYIKVHMNGGNGGTRNAISKISYFDRDGGEITLADASTNEHSTIISGYKRTTMDTSIYFIVDNDTVIDIGTITTINAVRLVRENDLSSYFYNTIISVSENNTDYTEIYNSYNNGSYGNDDRTNTYYETANGKVFPAVATKYSQTYDTIKTTSIREVI